MNSKDFKENLLIYFLSGFFCGLALLLLIYIIVFQSLELQFSFKKLTGLHEAHQLLFVLDILPLLSGSIAVYYVVSMGKRINLFNEQIKDILAVNDKALSLTRKFIRGEIKKSEPDDIPDNQLIIALEELRKSLMSNKEIEESNKMVESKKSWSAEGIAIFSEILRGREENIEDLAYKITSALVKYLHANQGGFFVTEKDKQDMIFFKMIACYAYDRKKFADKRIEWGEGLIGSAALERKSVYITDIPENYLTITSGLGKATPKNLLITPLISGEEVQGIIEIASFSRFEKHHIDFVEKLSESIAVTLSSIKRNIQTEKLLHETRVQAAELAAKEELVRQNIDKLRATQEEAAGQAEQFISFTNSVNHTLIRADYNKEGILLYANIKFLKKLGYSGNKEVEGKHISLFIDKKDLEWFNKIWESLSVGGKHFEGYMKHISKQGKDLWTLATYTCVRTEDGEVNKILFLAIDATEHKKQSLDFEGQMAALDRLSPKAEFTPDGRVLYLNDLFRMALKYNDQDLAEKSIFDFIDPRDFESFNTIWEQAVRGIPFQGQLRLHATDGEDKWFRGSISSANNMYNEVYKVIFIGNDITSEKLMEVETRKYTENLKIQEEKLRMSSIELSRKMEEKNAHWLDELAILDHQRKLYSKILYLQENIILVSDGSGMLFFLNREAERYWKIRSSDVTGKPLSEIFKSLRDMPEVLYHFNFPEKPVHKDGIKLKIPDSDGMMNTFTVRYTVTQLKDTLYYTTILKPEKE